MIDKTSAALQLGRITSNPVWHRIILEKCSHKHYNWEKFMKDCREIVASTKWREKYEYRLQLQAQRVEAAKKARERKLAKDKSSRAARRVIRRLKQAEMAAAMRSLSNKEKKALRTYIPPTECPAFAA